MRNASLRLQFIGTEIVAIASGEAKNPRRNLPKAIKTVSVHFLPVPGLSTALILLLHPVTFESWSFTS